MQKITPCLWFDQNAEEAVALYTSVFKGGKTHTIVRYPKAGHEVHGMPEGLILTIDFEIEGFRMTALNGGPHFKMNPAISFMVHCPTGTEIEALWHALEDGGTVRMPLQAYPFSEKYGWIEDKYGVSWQLFLDARITERRIAPSLLFVGEVCGQAEAAMNEYVSIFPDSRIGEVNRYGSEQAPDIEGTIMYADCELAHQSFSVMDSAHEHAFSFNEGISLMVMCTDQAEIDYFWQKLSAVPEAEMCGWVKDRYGVSWQITPEGMEKFLNDPDPEKRERAMAAMMHMKKIDIAKLVDAVA